MQYNPNLEFKPIFDTGAKLKQEAEAEEVYAKEIETKMAKRQELGQMVNLNKKIAQRKETKVPQKASIQPSRDD